MGECVESLQNYGVLLDAESFIVKENTESSAAQDTK